MPDTMKVNVETTADGIRFYVKVVPGSSRTNLAGILDGMLKIKVASPPEKGKANQCLTAYLSKLLGIRKNQVKILAGMTAPVKQLHIEGVSPADIQKLVDGFDA